MPVTRPRERASVREVVDAVAFVLAGLAVAWLAVLGRASYPQAPVSPLHLFGRVQDLAFQQEVDGRPTKRHHVRFWRCPEGWRLPGGYAVDWLAAGTYDRAVGLSLWTFQVTHRIERETDLERDHVVSGLTAAVPGIAVHRIEHFSSGYHARNGGGDRIVTDGTLPVLDLSAVPAATPRPGPHVPSLLRAPAPTLFGGAVALLRGLTALVSTAATALGADSLVDAGAPTLTVAVTVAVFAVTGLVDVGLAVAVVRGRDWARLLLLADSTLLIGDALVNDLAGGPRPTLGNGLPAVRLSILVMLALSSGRARAYPRERAAERAARARPRPGRPGSPVTTTRDSAP